MKNSNYTKFAQEAEKTELVGPESRIKDTQTSEGYDRPSFQEVQKSVLNGRLDAPTYEKKNGKIYLSSSVISISTPFRELNKSDREKILDACGGAEILSFDEDGNMELKLTPLERALILAFAVKLSNQTDITQKIDDYKSKKKKNKTGGEVTIRGVAETLREEAWGKMKCERNGDEEGANLFRHIIPTNMEQILFKQEYSPEDTLIIITRTELYELLGLKDKTKAWDDIIRKTIEKFHSGKFIITQTGDMYSGDGLIRKYTPIVQLSRNRKERIYVIALNGDVFGKILGEGLKYYSIQQEKIGELNSRMMKTKNRRIYDLFSLLTRKGAERFGKDKSPNTTEIRAEIEEKELLETLYGAKQIKKKGTTPLLKELYSEDKGLGIFKGTIIKNFVAPHEEERKREKGKAKTKIEIIIPRKNAK